MISREEWMKRLEAYWRSAEWKRKRKQRLEIDKHRCRICGATERLTVHHLPQSYALIPNESVDDDLITLCSRCHDEVATNLTRRDGYQRHAGRVYQLVQLVETIDRRQDNGLARKNVSVEIVGPNAHAQRPDREPVEQVRKSYEASILEARKDRRGL